MSKVLAMLTAPAFSILREIVSKSWPKTPHNAFTDNKIHPNCDCGKLKSNKNAFKRHPKTIETKLNQIIEH